MRSARKSESNRMISGLEFQQNKIPDIGGDDFSKTFVRSNYLESSFRPREKYFMNIKA